MNENMIQNIFNKLVEMEKKYDHQFAKLDKKIDGINKQVVSNAENIAVINNKLNIFDSTIDILSRRSIDHEAELKRLK